MAVVNFVEQVKAIGIPLDQLIVIGSGVLAAHGIRKARDIDLVVTSEVFNRLERDASWVQGKQGSSSYALVKEDIEVWTDWSTDASGHPDYDDLSPYTETIDGVRFVTLDYVERRKVERGSNKDIQDIKEIHEYRKSR